MTFVVAVELVECVVVAELAVAVGYLPDDHALALGAVNNHVVLTSSHQFALLSYTLDSSL